MEKERKKTSSTSKKRPSERKIQTDSKTSATRRRKRRRRRRKNPARSILLGLFLGLCICLFLFSIWKLATIFLGYNAGNKEYEELQQYVLSEPETPDTAASAEDASDDTSDDTAEEETTEDVSTKEARIDFASLKAINEDAVGWIEIPGTEISYPVVHTTDNTYYLTHTFRRQENKSGAIFEESSNASDFSDLHTIIYGHNMKNGSMFAGLKNYGKKNYYEAHPYIYLDQEDGTHCYQIFSCYEADVTDVTYTVGYAADDTYASFLDSLKTSSLYDTGVSVSKEDSVITLSTCTSNGSKRFVVHAKKLY